MIDHATAFHTLKPITNVVYTARHAEKLLREGAKLDLRGICYDGAIPTGPFIAKGSIDASKLGGDDHTGKSNES